MRKYILTFFKGLAMGAADVIPGVSGGTIAFFDRHICRTAQLNQINQLEQLKTAF